MSKYCEKGKIFECIELMCQKSFKNKKDLEVHMISHPNYLEKLGKMLKCELCNKIFKAKYNLNVHMIHHSDDRPYECKVCQKKFKTK